MTMPAVAKLAMEIDELVPVVGGNCMVSQFMSSCDRTQGTEERVLAFRKDTTSHAPLRHAGWRLACGASGQGYDVRCGVLASRSHSWSVTAWCPI